MMTKCFLILSMTELLISGLLLSTSASSSPRILTAQESSQVFGAQGFQCVSLTFASACQPIQSCLTKVCGDFGGSNIGTCNGSSQRKAIENRGPNGCQTAGAELSSVCAQITDCFGLNQCSTFVTMCKTEFSQRDQIWICIVNENWSGSVLQATAPLACASGGPFGE